MAPFPLACFIALFYLPSMYGCLKILFVGFCITVCVPHENISSKGQRLGLICSQLCPQCLYIVGAQNVIIQGMSEPVHLKTGLCGLIEFPQCQQLQMGKLRLPVVKSLALGFGVCALFIHTTLGW